ncbi:MAG: HAD family phosphatase [Deltaproteobacteria bacterium]|nr:HAD family phosphatase [Deltaproteobacteria bacterium]
MSDAPVVCFDLGDVLVRLRFERCALQLDRLAHGEAAEPRRSGLTPAQLFTGRRGMAYARGEIEPAIFFDEVCQELGLPAASLPEVVGAWCAIFEPWPAMQDLATRVVASGAPVWLLSNTDPVHMAHLRPQLPFLERFQGLWLSYQTGTAKPDPAYFTGFAKQTGYAPEQCLFIDDRPDNVAQAQALGWRAVLHRGDVAEVEAFLRHHGIAI